MEKQQVLQKVSDYIDESGFFLLATEDGEQPKCRPLNAHFLQDGTLFFATGRFKDVFSQMQANPNVEIVAVKAADRQFMRYYGTAVFEETYDKANAILETIPQFKKVYTMEGDMKLEVFHLENATVEFRNIVGIIESYEA